MKAKRLLLLVSVLVMVVLFASCDMISSFIESRTRPIPLIQIYNSNLEKTLKMVPNDTLYVQVQGLAPDKLYTVQCLDPLDNLITQFTAPSDENGVIGIRPLWYDIGFRTDENGNLYLPSDADLTLKAFHIRVVDAEEEPAGGEEFRAIGAEGFGKTDFRLPFFFVSSNVQIGRPQPIVLAGKHYEDKFVMENAFYSEAYDVTDQGYLDLFTGDDALEGTPLTNELYINVESMTPLFAGGENGTVRIYILPFTGDNYRDGDFIVQNALFYKDLTVQQLIDAAEVSEPSRDIGGIGPLGIHMPWPVNPPQQTIDIDDAVSQNKIPQWAEGQAFSVFLDMMDDGLPGYYNIRQQGFDSFYLDSIDGNGVAGFIVKEPPVLTADLVSMQLASGGVFRGRYELIGGYYRYVQDYDYRNTFIKSGRDTKYSSHSGAFWGYGVKVIWNPYSTTAGWQATGHTMPSNFWGRYVDVYIVPHNHSLSKGTTITKADNTYKCTLPVQYGCGNGWWQQTIWRAPMTPGDYMVIVDMDRDGKISDNDLVDNVRTDSGNGGFSVID